MNCVVRAVDLSATAMAQSRHTYIALSGVQDVIHVCILSDVFPDVVAEPSLQWCPQWAEVWVWGSS